MPPSPTPPPRRTPPPLPSLPSVHTAGPPARRALEASDSPADSLNGVAGKLRLIGSAVAATLLFALLAGGFLAISLNKDLSTRLGTFFRGSDSSDDKKAALSGHGEVDDEATSFGEDAQAERRRQKAQDSRKKQEAYEAARVADEKRRKQKAAEDARIAAEQQQQAAAKHAHEEDDRTP